MYIILNLEIELIKFPIEISYRTDFDNLNKSNLKGMQ